MSAAWATIAALAVSSALIRAAGPLLLGSRALPARFVGVIDLLGPAVLTALIVVQTVGGDREIEVGASIAGLAAAAGVLIWRRSALLGAIVIAAAVTAALRALG